MIRSLKIMLFTVFFLYGSSCFSQVTVAGDGLTITEISNNTTSDGTIVAVEDQDKDSGKQEKKGENKRDLSSR
ncbi:MAG: hypothetical protein IPN67_16300 [Bacteroidales bacterium]|nr:hypothetical protein [Bacteroidales bacterium]